MYSEERIKEIVDAFQQLLVNADNTGSSETEFGSIDFKKFWHGLRREGSNLFGVTRHLLGELGRLEQRNTFLEDKVTALEGDQKDQIVYIQDLNHDVIRLRNFAEFRMLEILEEFCTFISTQATQQAQVKIDMDNATEIKETVDYNKFKNRLTTYRTAFEKRHYMRLKEEWTDQQKCTYPECGRTFISQAESYEDNPRDPEDYNT